MKTRSLHIIIALTILIAVPNAYADGVENKKEKKNKDTKSEKVIKNIEKKLGQKLNFESWMTGIKDFSFDNDFFTEDELVLEEWMMEEYFVEEELELENWMKEAFFHNNHNANIMDQKLQFEPWMKEVFSPFNPDFEEAELEFEPWMSQIS